MSSVFAVIVVISILLCWILGVYAVYTYREVELAKIEQAHEIMKRVEEHEQISQPKSYN